MMQEIGVMEGLHSRGLVAIILLAIHYARGGLIMAEVLVRDLDASVVEKLKARAAANGRSLQAELKAILEEQARQVTQAEARALAARIRQRIGARPQTDSGMLQAEDRER
jgi:antitoxin FitA